MAKRKPRRRRRYQYRRTYRRRKKLPLIPLITTASIPLIPSREGWASPLEDAQKGKWKAVGAHIINGFQPFYSIHDPTLFRGKFELHVPRYLAMIFGGVIASKIASMIGANRIFQNAPSPFNKLKW